MFTECFSILEEHFLQFELDPTKLIFWPLWKLWKFQVANLINGLVTAKYSHKCIA